MAIEIELKFLLTLQIVPFCSRGNCYFLPQPLGDRSLFFQTKPPPPLTHTHTRKLEERFSGAGCFFFFFEWSACARHSSYKDIWPSWLIDLKGLKRQFQLFCTPARQPAIVSTQTFNCSVKKGKKTTLLFIRNFNKKNFCCSKAIFSTYV